MTGGNQQRKDPDAPTAGAALILTRIMRFDLDASMARVRPSAEGDEVVGAVGLGNVKDRLS
jgi:hypothetical protein